MTSIKKIKFATNFFCFSAVYCPEISLNVENGEIDCQGGITESANNIFGSTCVLICNEGWAADGMSRTSCNSFGQWTATLGRCRRKSKFWL